MQDLFDTFSEITQISENFKQYLSKNIEIIHVSKGEIIYKPSSIVNKVYFINKGVFRTFYKNSDKKIITSAFFDETMFVSELNSLKNDKASHSGLEALSLGVLYAFNRDQLIEAFARFPESSALYFHYAANLFTVLERNYFSIQSEDATTRYNLLLKNYPNIFQRVNLGHIATYLGMNQATLSRIRAFK